MNGQPVKPDIPTLDSIVPLSVCCCSSPPFSCHCFAAHSADESTMPLSPGTPPPSTYRRLHALSASNVDAQLSESTPTPGRSCGDMGTNLSPSKQRYVFDADVEVMKKIRQGEVKLRDHNTVLCGIKSNVCISFLTMFVPFMRVLCRTFHLFAMCLLPSSRHRRRLKKGDLLHLSWHHYPVHLLRPSYRVGLSSLSHRSEGADA